MSSSDQVYTANTQNVIINRETFEMLWDKHWRKVNAVCYNNINDAEVARELVQDIFRSLWERRGELAISDAERYLVRAAKLKTFEYIRNKVNREKHLKTSFIGAKTDSNTTEEQVLYNDLKTKVNTLVNTLPPQCKRVYKLSREQGLSNRDIANELLISERAVEHHITKALGVLKLSLSAYL